jgi:hypothetical protein
MDVMDLHEVGYVVTAFFDCNGLALGMVVRVMPSDFESTGCEGGCDQPTMRRERSMLHLYNLGVGSLSARFAEWEAR